MLSVAFRAANQKELRRMAEPRSGHGLDGDVLKEAWLPWKSQLSHELQTPVVKLSNTESNSNPFWTFFAGPCPHSTSAFLV